jgi:ribosomal protein S18 acetylase RimI-like enzyme
VDAAHRGKGYGKQTLELLDARMRSMGIARIALSVFGDNAIAMHLYQTMGYRTIATHMEKEL